MRGTIPELQALIEVCERYAAAHDICPPPLGANRAVQAAWIGATIKHAEAQPEDAELAAEVVAADEAFAEKVCG